MKDIVKKESEIAVSSRDIASLHEYLQRNNGMKNVAVKIFSDIHSSKGIGDMIVSERDHTLYHYNGNSIYYVFSIGGRVIVIITRPALPMTQSRKKLIKNRFLALDPVADKHMVDHFENLIGMSGTRHHSAITRSFAAGVFTVHMRDLYTPFVEIGQSDNIPLVIPMNFLIKASGSSLLPSTTIKYAGQHITVFTNDDYTVRVLYVSHLLDDSLFTGAHNE
jgi:hypothetical protein